MGLQPLDRRAGRIIEGVSGQSLDAVLTERILEPLQMDETTFHTCEAKPAELAERSADRWTGERCSFDDIRRERP